MWKNLQIIWQKLFDRFLSLITFLKARANFWFFTDKVCEIKMFVKIAVNISFNNERSFQVIKVSKKM